MAYNPLKWSFKDPTENAKNWSSLLADAFDIKLPNDDDKKKMTLDFCMECMLEEVIGEKECERLRASMKKIEEKFLDVTETINKVTSDDIVLANMEMLLGKETNPEDEQENDEVIRLSTIIDKVFIPVSDDCEENDNMCWLFDEGDDY